MAEAQPLLEVRDLRKTYAARAGWPRGEGQVIRAVEGVSFTVQARETFGLVGESGCGKSTVARCILRLVPPTGGQVFFNGTDLLGLTPAHLRRMRREMQIIFQDPYSSLDPRMTIRSTLLEPLEIHRVGNRSEQEKRVRELLDLVGLPGSALGKYPHEFSGGQCQRIGIARALALSPRLIVADEPVSALDLSIRGQVINLMADLQHQLGVAYLFIAHDLTLARHFCHRVAVMYRGKIVELASTEELFRSPLHPYTRRLLESIPVPDPRRRRPGAPRDFTPQEQDGEPEETARECRPELREVAPGHWARV